MDKITLTPISEGGRLTVRKKNVSEPHSKGLIADEGISGVHKVVLVSCEPA